jgi:hypothetical protein
VKAVNDVSPAAGARVNEFADEMEKILDQKMNGG